MGPSRKDLIVATSQVFLRQAFEVEHLGLIE